MPRFVLIDHSLADFCGHHYEYARAVLNAAAELGFEPVLAANRRFNFPCQEAWRVIPAYKYGFWFHEGVPAWQIRLYRALQGVLHAAGRKGSAYARQEGNDGRRGASETQVRRLYAAARNRQFARDTERVLRQLEIGGDDLVFLPTISIEEFGRLHRFWSATDRQLGPFWHFLFRRPPGNAALKNDHRLKAAPLLPHNLRNATRVRLWTDSEELTAQYQETTEASFGTLPIPHTPIPAVAPPSYERLRVLYLGDARLEKGFQHLPGIVRSLTEADVGRRQRFEFYFQAHGSGVREPREITAARAELTCLKDRGVTLISTALAPAKYLELLASGHIVVLPYDAQAYRARSSGVFAESLAAGLPLVVPAGSWMARQLPNGSGHCYRTLNEAPAMIQRIAANWQHYFARARHCSVAWRRRHSASRLVALLQSGSHSFEDSRPHEPDSGRPFCSACE